MSPPLNNLQHNRPLRCERLNFRNWSMRELSSRKNESDPLEYVGTLLVSMAISDRILDSGWIQGVCADILSHTWPVRGGDHPRTTPMPFQRTSTDFCGSPDHPHRTETAERATWGTKTPPRPPTDSRHPTRPGSCAAETTALGPTGAHLGGLPGGGAPAAGAPSPVALFRAIPSPPPSTRGKAQRHRSP
jgi:hypothetical protein